MIIDAMDILYSNNVDGFCIVSRIAILLGCSTSREAGMYVIGMGKEDS